MNEESVINRHKNQKNGKVELDKKLIEEIRKVLEDPETAWDKFYEHGGIMGTKERMEAFLVMIDETIENGSDQSTIDGLIEFREALKGLLERRIKNKYFDKT